MLERAAVNGQEGNMGDCSLGFPSGGYYYQSCLLTEFKVPGACIQSFEIMRRCYVGLSSSNKIDHFANF